MSRPVQLLTVDVCPSTNAAVARMTHGDGPVALRAVSQTAGRGQRGNKWEAAPGLNLTFTLAMTPPPVVTANRQFELSMLVSMAITDALTALLPAVPISIKWPNDIYAGDLKLCGILIENSLSGSAIARTVIGVGVNVNQCQFVSDAPNPVSMVALAGHDFDIDELYRRIAAAIADRVDGYDGDAAALTAAYNARLWRRDGRPHRWLDTDTGTEFDAVLTSVAPDGTLCLSGGRRYLFKQVAAVLRPPCVLAAAACRGTKMPATQSNQ